MTVPRKESQPSVEPLPPVRFDSDSSLNPVERCVDEPKTGAREAIPRRVPTRVPPSWAGEQLADWGERLRLPEWDEDEDIGADEEGGDSDSCSGGEEVDGCYRSENGWKGSDLCHSIHSPVRISHYRIQYAPDGVGTTLTGLVHFTPRAESHAGYCHGGSMTSVMDDVIGWTAFHVTGECRPWSGFTAQVNVSLKRPIAVGSYLKVVGSIARWEGRKVWISSKLVAGEGNEENEEVLHCTAEGLVILKRDS